MIKKRVLSVALASGILLGGHAVNASSATHTVQTGDSLWKISQSYNVTVSQLMDWNRLSSTTIYKGQTLTVGAQTSSTTYTVKKGDTLYGIANKYGMTVDAIKSRNNLTTNTIYIGQTLTLSGSNGGGATPSKVHTVKAGDTLFAIAQNYGTTIQAIKQANGLTSNTIYVGQKLQLSGSQEKAIDKAPKANIVDSIVSEGKKYIGVPYVWGGTSPAGFDCSGFLHYVFLQNGISIPRTVTTIWNAGTSVSNPSVGDLVFFETYKKGPSHAGIYLGGGQFLHAGSSTGVTISDMNNSYWSPRYLGAKRLH